MTFILGFLDPISFLLIVLFFVASWNLFRNDEKAAKIEKLPGPRAFPIVGNIKESLEPVHKLMENVMERRKKFGPIFRLWLGRQPAVILSRPEDIEVVLKGNKHTQKSVNYSFFEPWLGKGLLTSYGQKWATHRKLITPTFHFSVLQNFIEVFQENSNILVEKLSEKAKTGEEFDIYPLIVLCALDIICETAMGTKVNAQSENQSQYVKSVCRLTTLTTHRLRRIWLHPTFLFKMTPSGKEYFKHLKIVKDFAADVIKTRKEALKEMETSDESGNNEKTKKLTFLDLLIKSNMKETMTPLMDEELREEVDTFMFGGHDTTAASTSWALFLLGLHPDIQENVYAEVKSIYESKKEDLLTTADLAEMKLLERVIKETLRFLPTIFSIGRMMGEDLELGDYVIPKGVTAIISIYALHKDPNYYEDPEVFNPDRFLPENCAKRHPYAYIPFSAGPRNCIGQKFAMFEEKVVLSNLLYHYKFESVDKLDEIQKIPEVILRPQPGHKMRIYKR